MWFKSNENIFLNLAPSLTEFGAIAKNASEVTWIRSPVTRYNIDDMYLLLEDSSTKTENKIQVELTYEKESLWLSLNQISELFDRDKSVISRHIKNIFKEK